MEAMKALGLRNLEKIHLYQAKIKNTFLFSKKKPSFPSPRVGNRLSSPVRACPVIDYISEQWFLLGHRMISGKSKGLTDIN
jgi:hypothetical protein